MFIVAFIAMAISMPALAGYYGGGGYRGGSSSFGGYRSYSRPSYSAPSRSFAPAPYRGTTTFKPAPAPTIKAITAIPPKPVVLRPKASPKLSTKAKMAGAAVAGVAAGSLATHAYAQSRATPTHPVSSYASPSHYFSPSSVWFWLYVMNTNGTREQVKVSCDDPRYKDYDQCVEQRNKAASSK